MGFRSTDTINYRSITSPSFTQFSYHLAQVYIITRRCIAYMTKIILRAPSPCQWNICFWSTSVHHNKSYKPGLYIQGQSTFESILVILLLSKISTFPLAEIFLRRLEGFLCRLTFKTAELIGILLTPPWINH